MKLSVALKALSNEESIEIARNCADECNIKWEAGICFVFSAILKDPNRIPGNIGKKNDSEITAIEKWVKKYVKGFEGRPTVRISNFPGTVADPIIDKIIGARLSDLRQEDLEKIKYAHRLSMSAENILGLILEEYLAETLQKEGWHCAWGETVKAVDFVHENGSLL